MAWMGNSWPDLEYCWVVICKNQAFHHRQNLFFGHKIPLGRTDAFATLPALTDRIKVRCDDCGKEYSYQPAEVLRADLELPESFVPHPLFSRDD